MPNTEPALDDPAVVQSVLTAGNRACCEVVSSGCITKGRAGETLAPMGELYDLGVRTMRLMTNNPAKRAGLDGYGLKVVGREMLPTRPHPENLHYLRTKRDRMGHELDLPVDLEGLS